MRKISYLIRIIVFVAALVFLGFEVLGRASRTPVSVPSTPPAEELVVVSPELAPSDEITAVLDDVRTAVPSKPVPSTPPPLRHAAAVPPTGELTMEGIILWTNSQRRSNGNLPVLAGSDSLSAAALAKVDDMFARQYFEHVAPTGEEAGDLVAQQNYAFLTVGENLALGGFTDDQDVVAAWMDSPGHRANILSTSYTEMGAAARRGMFDGRETWLAVQMFATPERTCPPVSARDREQLTANDRKLDELRVALNARREQLDELKAAGDFAEHNELIPVFNAEVEVFNALVAETKSLAAQYNLSVMAYNECLASFTGN